MQNYTHWQLLWRIYMRLYVSVCSDTSFELLTGILLTNWNNSYDFIGWNTVL